MMQTFIFGKTVNGLATLGYQFGPQESKKHVLILGGVHGDEVESIALCYALLDRWKELLPFNLKLSLVPAFNMDGTLLGQRKNANSIDLNRNLPSKDWTSEVANERYYPGTEAGSEPENKALLSFLKKEEPSFIISLHSFSRFLLNVNGDCEPIASVLNRETNHPIEESMGYPTPGCLGTLTGLEMGIPTITYELERGADLEGLIALHAPAIELALQEYSKQ